MRILLTLSGLILLCASVVAGAGTLIDPEIHVRRPVLSEPAGLVALGTGFVLLANQVRKKKC